MAEITSQMSGKAIKNMVTVARLVILILISLVPVKRDSDILLFDLQNFQPSHYNMSEKDKTPGENNFERAKEIHSVQIIEDVAQLFPTPPFLC